MLRTLHSDSMPQMWKCSLADLVTGRSCERTFKRHWNFERHTRTQHKTSTIRFVDCNPSSDAYRQVTHHPVAISTPQNPLISPSTNSVAQSTVADVTHQPSAVVTPLDPLLFASINDLTHPSRAGEVLGSRKALRQSSITDISSSRRASIALHIQERRVSHDAPIEEGILGCLPPSQNVNLENTRKRKLSNVGYDRIALSRKAPSMPIYDLNISIRIPDQLKAIEWLTTAAKRTFYHGFAHRLAEWGVSKAHQGTCILVPEDWRNLDPMDLLPLFDLDNCPTAQVQRLRYQYADHSTSFVRALAWFAQWPRSGLQLDNFLGNGPFQPMDASHTCHHSSCIIHVVYDPAHINQDRKSCCELARKLRREGQVIPEHCDKHNPPCRLVLTSRTTNEVYALQFNVLRLARGLPVKSDYNRPRRHPYSAFEAQLPSCVPAIAVDPIHLITERPESRRDKKKPDLLCIFCKKIKAFDTPAGLWGHLVHKHDGVDISQRLEELRRTALEWKRYWDNFGEGGRRGHVTTERIAQVMEAAFDWDVVLSWNLR